MGTGLGPGVPFQDDARAVASRKRALAFAAIGTLVGSIALMLLVVGLLALQFRQVLG